MTKIEFNFKSAPMVSIHGVFTPEASKEETILFEFPIEPGLNMMMDLHVRGWMTFDFEHGKAIFTMTKLPEGEKNADSTIH